MKCHSLIINIILPFFILFPVCNVARFVTSGYLDKNSIVLPHASLSSKTDWANLLSVVCEYIPFFLSPFFKQYYQPLKLRGALHRQDKRLPGRSILRMIYRVNIGTHLLFSKGKNYLVVLIY